MSDLTSESCTTKIKQWWIDFYNSPCFGIKCISTTIILGLAIFGLFKIITSAFYYFSEPLSYFDPERLGQLGDFLGGTLNPIFGFATVCLLLWSIFIQKKELSLTRDELSKSARALDEQVGLATNEYNRKQLDIAIDRLYDTLKELYEQTIKPSEYTYIWNESSQKNIITRIIDIDSLSGELRAGAISHITDVRENIDKYQDINLYDTKTLSRMLAAIELVLENLAKLIEELIIITSIEQIRKYRFIEFEKEVEKLRGINIITNEKSIELLISIKKHVQIVKN